MASNMFCLYALLILYLVPSTMSTDFNCSRKLFNVAFVYDCRYSLSQQQNVFTLFLQKFKPLKWIINYSETNKEKFEFNFYQMTYISSKLRTFQQLTKENFTQQKFKTTPLKLNTKSCSQTVLIDIFLNEMENSLISKKDAAKTKLVILMLEKNANQNDGEYILERYCRQLEERNDYVKIFFILINTQKLYPENQMSRCLETNSLENRLQIIKKMFELICKDCENKFEILSSHSKCYNFITPNSTKTASESEDICKNKWHGSHLGYINSISELHYLLSDLGIVTHFSYIESGGTIDSPSIQYNKGFKNGLNQIFIATFIGLSKDYNWNDGSPLVIDPPWGSKHEGQGCVYISLNFSYTGGIATNEKHEWIKIDCNKTTSTNFILCESQTLVEGDIFLHFHDLKYKDQYSHLNLFYKSYLNLLFNQVYEESENELMSLFKKTIKINITQYSFNVQAIDVYGNQNYVMNYLGSNDLFRQSIQSRHRSPQIKPNSLNSLLFNSSYQLLREQKNGNTNSAFLNNSQFNPTYLQYTISNVSKCLYETDSERRRIGFYYNSFLHNCKPFMCPPGFFKCPDSYCVPMYHVHDGVKDCPHGEDEMSDKEKILCTRTFKFTLRNLCLEQDVRHELSRLSVKYLNTTNNFICPVPCDNNYVCVSNVVSRDVDNETTVHVSYLEATVQLYEESGLYTFTPQMYSLFLLNKLVEVDLSGCNLKELDNVIKSLDISDIQFLDVSNNDIEGRRYFSVIQEMKILQFLNMSFNKNLEIDDNFIFPSKLQVLDMSYTKCWSALIKALKDLTHLKILVLRHIKPIDLSPPGKLTLEIFDVRGTTLLNIKYGYLSWLSVENALFSDDYRICCDVIKGPHIVGKKCHAPRDAISTCEDLIGNPLKRVILWIVSVLSLVGNMSVVIYRLVWDRVVMKKAYGIYVVLLGISDFIMGVYLLIIASADMLYRNSYVLSDYNWRYSYICKLAGMLSTFSAETSTVFICLITLDRFMVIRYPFSEHRISKIGKYISICLTLLLGALVSVVPALYPNWKIYSYNGMCLALPLSSRSYAGWEFSAFLFVGFNFIMFILIAIGQVAICIALFSYHKNLSNITRDTSRRAKDSAIARQLFLVALSDFCCWFPIGIMGIMSLRGFEFNLEVYAWLAVLVLPINSAINPLMYTVPAILKKINKYSNFCRSPSRSGTI